MTQGIRPQGPPKTPDADPISRRVVLIGGPADGRVVRMHLVDPPLVLAVMHDTDTLGLGVTKAYVASEKTFPSAAVGVPLPYRLDHGFLEANPESRVVLYFYDEEAEV